jgi:glycine dehydrogenase subunit 1
MTRSKFIHPYIPNSVPEVREKMLQEIGITNADQLYSEIPEELRFKGKMNIPKPLLSEWQIESHMDKILSKNKTAKEALSFLGAGCYQHYVPAICDEIAGRAEFLTAYAGEPYEDHGRFQTLFEYQSMMAELLDMDVVNVPTYDWGQAAATAVRMAGRITGRNKVLAATGINPQRLLAIRNYCAPAMKVEIVKYHCETGCLDIEDLKSKLTDNVAAIYLENPNYFGVIELQGHEIAGVAHENGSLFVVGVDPISLGILAPPSHYGADIVCGDIQTLGIHMNYGAGVAGFIAAPDKREFVAEYPSRLFGISRTEVEGEWGFGDVFYDRTSFARRELGKEFVGTAAALWGIVAGVYLAVMGPKGMQDVGCTIMQNSSYAAKILSDIPGIKIGGFQAPFFREFIANFDEVGLTVAEVNRVLREKGIWGGKDISKEFPELGQSALYCVTEIHTKEDILTLCDALTEIVSKEKGERA